MTPLLQKFSGRLFSGVVIFAIVLIASTAVQRSSSAAELAEQAHSLRAVPADAAFYSASLRLKDQCDILLESKAYAKLMEIPLIQFAKMQAVYQWQESSEPNIAEFREYFESEEGQEALAVLKEMVAEEIFMCGGNDIAGIVKLLMELNGIQRTARLEAAATDQEPEDVMAERVRQLFEERADELQVPTLALGFRIKDADRARRQLDEVHGLVRNVFDAHHPELSAHLQRDQIAGHEFLTLRLDGSMIPWDKLREESADDVDPEQFNKWKELVTPKTLAVALGVVDEFVLLFVGDSTDALEHIGEGPCLVDQPGIARLKQHAEQRIASISYLSQEFANSLGSPEKTAEDLAGTADEVLRQAEIDDELRQHIVDDVRALDLSKFMPKPGETTSVTFLTPRGYEAYKYQSGTQPMLRSSEPLTILDHVGGKPMLLVASRSNDTVEDYDQCVAWLKRTAAHVEKAVESKTNAEDWAKYMQIRDRGIELLRRLNLANHEHLYPAFENNQGALVVDITAESKQWVAHMPESPKPLPMFEVAIVAGVSDAEHLRAGAKEYFAVARDTLALIREVNPDEAPEFDLPKPQMRELDGGGRVYVYPLPGEWGIDEQVALNAGMTDSAAVVSLLPATTERLLKSTPAAFDTSLDLKRPAAVVSYFDFEQMLKTLRPWIDYGLDVATGKLKPKTDEEDGDEEEPDQPNPMLFQLGLVVPQVYQFLDVAAAMRSFSSVTYQEDGVWITHSEAHFEDLK
jgi:hypothetical protein